MLVLSCFSVARAAEANRLLIDRKARRLLVIDNQNKTVLVSPVGLGKGGAGLKKSMADCITPSGQFRVDIILYKESKFNAVSQAILDRYRQDTEAYSFLRSRQGLERLFSNMNSLDFNSDGAPDNAYGAGYIGLDSAAGAISGPKMSKYKGKSYWFSIALHGTADESRNIGKLNSGGCVQVPAAVLEQLITKQILGIGSLVVLK